MFSRNCFLLAKPWLDQKQFLGLFVYPISVLDLNASFMGWGLALKTHGNVSAYLGLNVCFFWFCSPSVKLNVLELVEHHTHRNPAWKHIAVNSFFQNTSGPHKRPWSGWRSGSTRTSPHTWRLPVGVAMNPWEYLIVLKIINRIAGKYMEILYFHTLPNALFIGKTHSFNG